MTTTFNLNSCEITTDTFYSLTDTYTDEDLCLRTTEVRNLPNTVCFHCLKNEITQDNKYPRCPTRGSKAFYHIKLNTTPYSVIIDHFKNMSTDLGITKNSEQIQTNKSDLFAIQDNETVRYHYKNISYEDYKNQLTCHSCCCRCLM